MDSSVVSRGIRQRIRPLLRDAGFTRFTDRTAWRFAEKRVEVVNFQSYNSYNAGVLGCTTYSFSLNLGSYLLEVPPSNLKPPRHAGGRFIPQEYQCHLRRRLNRGFAQAECRSRGIWYIDPDGAYLERALDDVRTLLPLEALPWFEVLRDARAVYETLLNDSADMTRLWGFGHNPSPRRSYLIGYMALALEEREVARRALDEALRSGSFTEISERLARDIEACGPTTRCS